MGRKYVNKEEDLGYKRGIDIAEVRVHLSFIQHDNLEVTSMQSGCSYFS